jgi:hypothetical protein
MKRRFVDPAEIARAYRDPLSWASLAVDLLPVVAVFAFGWGATPLVALYWLENLVIGVFTIFRMIGTAAAALINLAAALFVVPFFIVHYGGFCYGHGIFLNVFATGGDESFPTPASLIRWAFGTAPEMPWFVGAIAAVAALYFLAEFIGRGEFRQTIPAEEMGAPYGRIITLHIAIILGAAVAFSMDEPLAGVLLLILIRVVFGIAMTVMRRRKREAAVAAGASLVEDGA